MNDHQLLDAYVQGDEQAFETLVEKYFRMVYTVATRQTGDPHLAEEIAQSTFLILSRKARGFSSNASVPGWLLRTTRFVGQDAIKMRRRRADNERKLAVNLEPQLETNTEPSSMEVLLDEAIQTLRPDEQAGILARFFEGKDFQELAEMFSITELAARKRTSRSLAKLQTFMAKRGARVASVTLLGLQAARSANEPTPQALQSAIHAAHEVWKGKVAAKNVVALADHATRLLRWRFLAGLGLKLALPILAILVGISGVQKWLLVRPDARIERLGIAWGAVDHRVASVRQATSTAASQAAMLQEANAIGREYSRIMQELNPLLAPPDDRARLARFFTAELGQTLNLDASQKAALFSYLLGRLAQGATLKEAMQALAAETPTEAAYIKGMLFPNQQQLFDQTYGVDGSGLFGYAKAVTSQTIETSAPR